ncbi:MAG: DNA alkylation repair protein [Candidatus Paceibacterota bacterium]|jgi:3-methyladenine DNA glycosylase AlkD
MTLIKNELKSKSNKEKAQFLLRFFKTKKGQYGEGDIFWGIVVPEQRLIAKKFKDIDYKEIQNLLNDKIHECRLTALLVLIEKYKKADEKEREFIFKLYLKNYKNINNWDLVDLSAPKIIGGYLIDKDKKILYDFALSNNLWKKRIAIVATYSFIKEKKLDDTFKIAEILLKDEHDLIHKAVGWMLREAGKRDKKMEIKFLKKYANIMPRTMLRYAIEKFTTEEREYFLNIDKRY